MSEARRESDREAVSKATALPRLTVGFAIVVAGLIWLTSQRVRDFENAITALITQIEDVADRQRKYIGQDGALTENVQALDDEIQGLREYLAAKHGEVLP